jgi:hypothetical protein
LILISSLAINIYRNSIEQGRLPMTNQHLFPQVQAVIACWYCNPHEEIIPLFQYILKKLNDYNLAFVQITGPAQDLTSTPAEVLQNEYFSHFRYHDNGRLMVTWALHGGPAMQF